ncbi:MAG: PqqD family peptide modification chaperone [Microbacterium sp.]|nr:PqqD family peptide modification chaperone [Microbacterium sp.]
MTAEEPRWHRAPAVLWTDDDDVVYVVDPEGKDPFLVLALEGTAAAIWRRLEAHPALDDVITSIALEYELAPDDVGTAVADFLRGLSESGLATTDADENRA